MQCSPYCKAVPVPPAYQILLLRRVLFLLAVPESSVIAWLLVCKFCLALLTSADLSDSQSYVSSINIIQPLFIAASIFLAEMSSSRQAGGDDPLHHMLVMITRQNLEKLIKALRKMAIRWQGAEFPLHVRCARSRLLKQQLLKDMATLCGELEVVNMITDNRVGRSTTQSRAVTEAPMAPPVISGSGNDHGNGHEKGEGNAQTTIDAVSNIAHAPTDVASTEDAWVNELLGSSQGCERLVRSKLTVVIVPFVNPRIETFSEAIPVRDVDPWSLNMDLSDIFDQL